jgi:hypothetical protein
MTVIPDLALMELPGLLPSFGALRQPPQIGYLCCCPPHTYIRAYYILPVAILAPATTAFYVSDYSLRIRLQPNVRVRWLQWLHKLQKRPLWRMRMGPWKVLCQETSRAVPLVLWFIPRAAAHFAATYDRRRTHPTPGAAGHFAATYNGRRTHPTA